MFSLTCHLPSGRESGQLARRTAAGENTPSPDSLGTSHRRKQKPDLNLQDNEAEKCFPGREQYG